MVPRAYDASTTAKVLRSLENIHYPFLGSFKPMFEASERIIRSPLRMSVWEQNEIQSGNVSVISDAARVLPLYAGQGKMNTVKIAQRRPFRHIYFIGASFGIEDATVLVVFLPDNPPRENEQIDFRDALEEYASARVSRAKKVATMASWSGPISMGERWWWRWIRDLDARLSMGGDPNTWVSCS